MKKILVMALLLSSILLTSGISAAVDGLDGNCQDYLCTGTVTCNGQVVEFGEAGCGTLCIEDYTALLMSPDFGCTLGLITPKQMVGPCDSIYDWLSCYAELHGRTLETNCYLEDDMNACIIKATCTPCSDCCDDK